MSVLRREIDGLMSRDWRSRRRINQGWFPNESRRNFPVRISNEGITLAADWADHTLGGRRGGRGAHDAYKRKDTRRKVIEVILGQFLSLPFLHNIENPIYFFRPLRMIAVTGHIGDFASNWNNPDVPRPAGFLQHYQNETYNFYLRRLFYRVTHQVVTNLPLTPKQKFRFGLAWLWPKPKQNFCFDVNLRFYTTWCVTL